ncbi:MAG: beta-phosphoglucomutase [Armatimonadota bacterium]|nr:beta-phosphoglucomutase [Armatimonadota bacterium]
MSSCGRVNANCSDYAVIFDLDGVIVSTDDCHYRAWKRLADEECIPFDAEINNRLRGVSRMESLEIILEKSPRVYSDDQKQVLAERKNGYYRELLQSLSPSDVLPGALELITALKERGFRVAIGSSSRNCPIILERIGLKSVFDVVVDGNCISRSKPDPEVFMKAAEKLGIPPKRCVVIEDAEAGVEAAARAGMPVIAVGAAAGSPLAALSAQDLTTITADTIIRVLAGCPDSADTL